MTDQDILKKITSHYSRDETLLVVRNKLKKIEFENGVLKSELAEAQHIIQEKDDKIKMIKASIEDMKKSYKKEKVKELAETGSLIIKQANSDLKSKNRTLELRCISLAQEILRLEKDIEGRKTEYDTLFDEQIIEWRKEFAKQEEIKVLYNTIKQLKDEIHSSSKRL